MGVLRAVRIHREVLLDEAELLQVELVPVRLGGGGFRGGEVRVDLDVEVGALLEQDERAALVTA